MPKSNLKKSKTLRFRTKKILYSSVISIILSVTILLFFLSQMMGNLRQETIDINNLRIQIHSISVFYLKQNVFQYHLLRKIDTQYEYKISDSESAQYDRMYKNIIIQLDNLETMPIAEEYKENLLKFRYSFENQNEYFLTILENFEKIDGYEELINQFFTKEKNRKTRSILESIIRKLNRRYYEAINSKTVELEYVFLISTVVFLLFFVALYLLLGFSIIVPINRIIRFSNYLSRMQVQTIEEDNQLSFDFERYKSYPILKDDEIGVLIKNFNDFISIIGQRTQLLKENQKKLFASEKMVALGQLVSGISHELNTPAAAIQASALELSQEFYPLLKKLYFVMEQIHFQDQKKYILEDIEFLFKFSFESVEEKSTQENRSISKDIASLLDENDVDGSRKLASDLSKIGFNRSQVEKLIPFYKTSLKEDIHRLLYLVGTNRLHIRDINIATQRIVRLVQALKNQVRVGRGKIIRRSLIQGIEEALVILNNKIKKGIQVVKDYEKYLPLIGADFESLDQVWINIINNAIQAMEGQGLLTIKVYSKDRFVVTEIQDDGKGISPEVQDRLFEPYFTTKPAGQGTGIGLDIAKDIIEKQNGSIHFTTELGKGTCFIITLPV